MDLKAIGIVPVLIATAIDLCAGGRFGMAQAYPRTNLVPDIQIRSSYPPDEQTIRNLCVCWGSSPALQKKDNRLTVM